MRRRVGKMLSERMRLLAPASGGIVTGIGPTLRAYGGLRVPAARNPENEGRLGRIGSLEARLAGTAKDVRRAQKLRYKVFYGGGAAIADAATRIAQRDIDAFDAICDHILVLDHDEKDRGLRRKPRVVGTYRLLHQQVATEHGGFYTNGEFDIETLTARHRDLRFLEVGRSCVLPSHRNKRTVELLWHGIWSQVLDHDVDVMFGCASFEGRDPFAHAQSLSYLHYFARAPDAWCVDAVANRGVPTNLLPKQSVDVRLALRAMPPLIKGYLRLGAYVSRDAVIDHQFGTTDVLIVLPTAQISSRYVQHFGPGAERHAA